MAYTIHIKLDCAGKSLSLGPGEEADITKISGLESAKFEVGLSDLAVVAGASLDGRHVKPRPIHIEGSFRSFADMAERREQLVRFFNPEATGTLTATIGERTRQIDYELEGWALKEAKTLSGRVGFVADLICPDPYFLGPSISRIDEGRTTYTVTNPGDAPAGWKAEFANDGLNIVAAPSVSNAGSGYYFGLTSDAFVFTYEEGHRGPITLSTERRARPALQDAEKDGKLVSLYAYIDRGSTLWLLPPGQASVKVSSSRGSPTVTFSFRPRYLGI